MAMWTGFLFSHSHNPTSTGIIQTRVIRRSCDSSVSIVTWLCAGRSDFYSQQGQGFFLYPPRPDRIWGLSNLLYSGYRRLFPWG